MAVGAQWSKFALGLMTTVLLARVLTPDDFGLIGMVSVVVGLAETLRDAGLTSVMVQAKDLSREQASALFWANVAFLGLMGVLVACAAPLVAGFYGRPELRAVTLVLAGSFVVNGLSVQHEALLRRQMKFLALGVAQVASKAVALAVALAMALVGYRYWALVGGTVTAAAVSTVLVFVMIPWIPTRARRTPGVGRMLRAGADITTLNVVGYLARNTDYILIGRFLGSVPLGQYSKAFDLSMIPTSQIRTPISDVALPALSALQQDDERYVRYYRAIVAALAVLIVPISLVLVVHASFLVRVTLGPQWTAAVAPLRVLAVAGLLVGLASTRGTVLMSRGLTRRYLGLGVWTSVVTAVAFAVGLRWGVIGVAWGYVVANLVVLLPTLRYAFGGTPLSPRDFLQPVVRPLLFALAAAGVSMLVRAVAPGYGIVAEVVGLAAFAAVYCGFVWRDAGLREMARAVLAQSGLRGAST
jgi:PST family polysaccharide transporter